MGGSKGSSTSTTTQKADPWAGVQPYLIGGGGTPIYENQQVENPNYRPGGKGGSQYTNQRVRIGTDGAKTGIFPEAEALYNNGLQSYGGQTVTPFADETEQSLQMRSNLAGQSNASIGAANDRLGSIINSQAPQFGGEQNFMSAYGNDIANYTNDAFNKAGRTGSLRHSGNIARNLGDASQRVYQQEQDRNQSSYFANQADQLRAATLSPVLDQARYQGADQLGQVGAARENLQNEYNADAMRRFQEGQDLPWENLNRFSSILSSQQLPTSSVGTSSVPTSRSPLGSALGGGLGGFAATGSPWGAAVGALGGLFG